MSSSVIDSPVPRGTVPSRSAIARVELLLAASAAGDADAEQAIADLGGALRHVAVIERRGGATGAWRGLAVIPHGHLLAGVPDRHAAAVIHPHSGPAVLLATPSRWPDEVLALMARLATVPASSPTAPAGADAWPAPPSSSWVVGLTFPHALPPAAFIEQLLAGAGLSVRRLALPPASRPACRCWADLHPAPSADVARALAALHRVHRVAGQSSVVI